MEKKKPLLDPVFLKKLDRLRVNARRAFPGTMRGERRSTRRGSSVEFSDFRKYEAGDDFRHIDWNIYARLERLMLRQFVEEEDVRIDILIDQSLSMHFGEPVSKFDFARKTAAALAFLGIGSLDRVGLMSFDAGIKGRLRAMRGRGHLASVISFLESLAEREGADPPIAQGDKAAEAEAEGSRAGREGGEPTSLRSALRAYQKANPKAGILFVVSDFLDRTDFRQELKLLAHKGYDANLIQVLSPEEMDPEVGGDLLLVDSETGEGREVTINDRLLASYRAALSEYTTSLENFCRKHGVGYSLISAGDSFEDLLLKNLIQSHMAE
ncbi:MAG TPA: DUF58 domain-containing protein [Blastocatellia bacterium]|jgi:uncharacterized protein (DUF58 family)|nr:DUF58 domain-containing protein [Blastocatellia bacterium]